MRYLYYVDWSKTRKMYNYACFIDYSKAFDTVNHEPLIELRQSIDTDTQDIKRLANLYWNLKVTVRHNRELNESFNIKHGVRHECVASPRLFALYTEMIMRSLEANGGIRIGSNVINNLRYADNRVVIPETETDLQQLMYIVIQES